MYSKLLINMDKNIYGIIKMCFMLHCWVYVKNIFFYLGQIQFSFIL